MKFFTLFIIIILFGQFSFINESLETPTYSEKEIKIQENKNIMPTIENLQQILSKTPKVFTENCGQLKNEDIKFYSPGGGMWFTNNGIWFEIKNNFSEDYIENKDWFESIIKNGLSESLRYQYILIKQEFMNANFINPCGKEKLKWNSNFFYGSESSQWKINVPNFNKIYYKNIYDGIDLQFYFHENSLKYDFLVNPGADPNQIKIKYIGAKELIIDNYGDLIIKTEFNNIVDSDLNIYQSNNNIKYNIKGNFVKYSEFVYGFKISMNYDKQSLLVIDPKIKLEYSTYIGGSSHEFGYGLAIDSTGNTYITGYTSSSDFPTTPGANDSTFNGGSEDVIVYKLDPNGSFIPKVDDDQSVIV